jgi:threo-3-hydroxy-L-aspartate ammonia-lyase
VITAAIPSSSSSRSDSLLIDLRDVREAAARLEGVAHRTPVLTSRTLEELTGAEVLMKAENFQRAGAFKFRGAFNKLSSLTPHELAAGIGTYSSGNHAQAVALAGRMLGAEVTILMPADAPTAKVKAVQAYGGNIVTYDRYSQNRTELGTQLAADRGLTLVPPFDDELVIAGQGTVALEVIEDYESLDVLLAPVSGGGLIAGCATAAKHLLPNVKVIGVEPQEGDDTKRSLDSGERIRIPVPQTIADGLQNEMPGAITFAINSQLVDDIVLVTDAEIIRAMAFAFDYLKIVLEPSGASALAALLAHKLDSSGMRIGLVLSGGNVGVDAFVRLVSGASKDLPAH